MPKLVESPATVRHISKDHIAIAPADGYSVTVFNIADAHIEAIVTSDDGSETIRLLIEAPGPGRSMAITRPTTAPSVVYITYTEKPGA